MGILTVWQVKYRLEAEAICLQMRPLTVSLRHSQQLSGGVPARVFERQKDAAGFGLLGHSTKTEWGETQRDAIQQVLG